MNSVPLSDISVWRVKENRNITYKSIRDGVSTSTRQQDQLVKGITVHCLQFMLTEA